MLETWHFGSCGMPSNEPAKLKSTRASGLQTPAATVATGQVLVSDVREAEVSVQKAGDFSFRARLAFPSEKPTEHVSVGRRGSLTRE